MQPLSSSAIDRLGERLRSDDPLTADDLSRLDHFRLSFQSSYTHTVRMLRSLFVGEAIEISGRHAKSSEAIIAKLKRESIRLSQMQDIAGCRLIVSSIAEQNRSLQLAQKHFDVVAVFDRRQKTKPRLPCGALRGEC